MPGLPRAITAPKPLSRFSLVVPCPGAPMDYAYCLKRITAECEPLAAAVITRDGVVVASETPPGASSETFSIMCATMMGAGLTALAEVGRSPPSRITLDGEVHMAVLEADEKHIVAVVSDRPLDIANLESVTRQVFGPIPAG